MNQFNNIDYKPSRLYIYYNERLLEGTVDQDSGASIADSVESIVKYGICPEDMWKYDITKFTEKPNDDCYKFGKSNYCKTFRQLE
jgi:C1A family cysteine protease